MKATIWHNPRCSKSRAALALLLEAGAEVEIVDYLNVPPSRETLAMLYATAGMRPTDVLRSGEAAAAGLDPADDMAILDAMAANPALIERPLVRTAKGVRLGRPKERIAEIL